MDEFLNPGLVRADNVIHDTEGYKQVRKQTAGAFAVATWFTGVTLHSIRSMQVRSVGGNNANRIAAIVKDFTTTPLSASLQVGVEGQAGPFTTASLTTATLISVGACVVKSFSVAELESGGFVAVATFLASLADGGSTVYSISGEAAYTQTAEADPGGPTLTTSLDGTQAPHSNSTSNADSYAGIYLKSDGNEYSVDASGTSEGTLLSGWLDTGLASDAYVKASLTSGTLYQDAGRGTYLPLTTSRKWAIRQTTNGTSSAIMVLDIASDSGGLNVVDTATYTLTAIRNGVDLSGTSFYHYRQQQTTDTTAGVYLKSDGVEYAYAANGTAEGTSLGSYVSGLSTSALWARATVISGTLTSGTTGSWLGLGTSRGWYVTREGTNYGESIVVLNIEVATDSGGSNVIDTAQYTLTASVESP